MNTEQNYVGKGDSANTPPQSTKNDLLTPLGHQLLLPPDSIVVNRLKYGQLTALHQVVDNFLFELSPSSLVEILNGFLYSWLTRGTDQGGYYGSTENQNKLFNTQQLSEFLVKLHEYTALLAEFKDADEKEVCRG